MHAECCVVLVSLSLSCGNSSAHRLIRFVRQFCDVKQARSQNFLLKQFSDNDMHTQMVVCLCLQ